MNEEGQRPVVVDLELILADFETPFAEEHIYLGGLTVPVSIQRPKGLTHRVKVSPSLLHDEALVVVGLPINLEEPGELLLVLEACEEQAR